MRGFEKCRPAWAALNTVPSLMLAAILLLGVSADAARAMAEAPRELDYTVRHSVFGDIGTYSNVIEQSGNTFTIKTAAHFLVKALGVGLHREDASRVEQWQGDRLVFFHGITTKNGDTSEITGKANGNNFVINSATGTITAPASVRPANPWSLRSLDSTAMMRVDTGKVEAVKVSTAGETNVTVNGASVPAKEYDIKGATSYKIWFDKAGTPVMFVVDDDSGQVTFTLKK